MKPQRAEKGHHQDDQGQLLMDGLAAAQTRLVTAAGRATYHQKNLTNGMYGKQPSDPVLAPPEEANLVGSAAGGMPESATALHLPTIDLDVPAYLIESSTPGHTHLYIDVSMTTKEYFLLLDVLADVRVVERKYVEWSKARGQSFVRRPGVKKGQ